jgi:MerR family transcriptional regulator, light-induced transcriptional regulator
MSGIRTNAAAAMLGISTSTLRTWERRYGFPRPVRSPGGHRQYALAEIEALRLTLAETHNVSSAVALARERGEGPPSPARLAAAFANFDDERSDRLLEESLTLRSVERTIEDVLLDAVATHALAGPTPEYEFAWRHAAGWMSAVRRLTPPPTRTEGILVIDDTAALSLEALHAQSLELMLRRAGFRTMSLSPVIEPSRMRRALRVLGPSAIVVTATRPSLDAIGRMIYAVRGAAPDVAVFDYRGAVPDGGASTVYRLGDRPLAARDGLVSRLEARARATSHPGRRRITAATAPAGVR